MRQHAAVQQPLIQCLRIPALYDGTFCAVVFMESVCPIESVGQNFVCRTLNIWIYCIILAELLPRHNYYMPCVYLIDAKTDPCIDDAYEQHSLTHLQTRILWRYRLKALQTTAHEQRVNLDVKHAHLHPYHSPDTSVLHAKHCSSSSLYFINWSLA